MRRALAASPSPRSLRGAAAAAARPRPSTTMVAGKRAVLRAAEPVKLVDSGG